jgi:hypothetical protein
MLIRCTTSPTVAAIDKANKALSTGDCQTAISTLQPIFDSSQSNNEIRIAMAAAYGCYSGLNFFGLLNALTTSTQLGSLSGFWRFSSGQFPSSATPIDDRKPATAAKAIDALLATLNPGTVLLPALSVNTTTPNPGSLVPGDRTSEANTFLTFTSWTLIGTILHRYGEPDEENAPTVHLPWVDANTVDADGCMLVSAILNYTDGLAVLSEQSEGPVGTALGLLGTLLSAGMDQGCKLGCLLCAPQGVSCTACPLTLRDRNTCEGSNTDTNSCAAAGLLLGVDAAWHSSL